MTQRVLICDDEPDVRASMMRTLRDYEVVEASSPSEALAALRTGHFGAIVSDYSLDAEADGLDLLLLVRLQYPATVRFLVTANRDVDVAVRAVNERAVDRYFLKPWTDSILRAALAIALHSARR